MEGPALYEGLDHKRLIKVFVLDMRSFLGGDCVARAVLTRVEWNCGQVEPREVEKVADFLLNSYSLRVIARVAECDDRLFPRDVGIEALYVPAHRREERRHEF